MMFLCK